MNEIQNEGFGLFIPFGIYGYLLIN